MKLKYYFRGIGIGILVTTLIFICAITAKGGIMTDEKAVSRAVQLGYTKNDTDASGNATNALEEQLEQYKNKDNTPASGDAAVQAGIKDNAQQIVDHALEPSEDADAEQSQTVGSDSTNSKNNTDNNSDENKDSSSENKNEISAPKTMKLVIYSNMGSESVASRLKELGVIDDASDYNQYLIDNGYSRRIQNGTFTIPMDASYQEITKIITNR